jgi:large subunit ribosomal protein L9
MKVVLLTDIKNIGKVGDIKDVANGFARNFLFPKKLAEMATDDAIKKAETIKQKQAESVKKDLEATQELANQLDGKEVVISAKAKGGKLFGSITAKNIVKELKKEKFDIKESYIILEPIKELGEYDFKIELEHGIEIFLKLIVKEE